ncbi:unnamed protein product [Ectocarpus sp. CCAP 1310/34]|nr:unnamed protein product [Ectocarpus sp. CCAP 1310/34]
MSGGVSQEELAAKLGEVESTLTARFEEQQTKAEGRMEQLLSRFESLLPTQPNARRRRRRGTYLRLWAPALGTTAGSAGPVPKEVRWPPVAMVLLNEASQQEVEKSHTRAAEQAFIPADGAGKGESPNRALRKGNSDGKGNGDESGGGGAEKRARVRCFRCGKMGHRIAECPTKESDIIRCEVCKGFGHKKDRCTMEEEKAVIAVEMSQDELDIACEAL